ncbi:hypothetical protein T459_30277 [Capsicum annuum]|uniref:Retrotransposon gag domain-containing protein n=1 Tax=Capsicum annuum TaxID=4072 RepID=A0A2G2Y7Z9_CAPAN|nr:hypothetical protein T459_30277 [Capsicum annuum]
MMEGDLVAYLRHYCNQLRGYGGKEELFMAYVGESVLDLASERFVDQDIDRWNSWDDLANEFVQQFQYNEELIPDKKSLTSMKKMNNTESFRKYAIRWREQAARGHSIEDCRDFKREIKKMIQDRSFMMQNIGSEKNSSHSDMQTSGQDQILSENRMMKLQVRSLPEEQGDEIVSQEPA